MKELNHCPSTDNLLESLGDILSDILTLRNP